MVLEKERKMAEHNKINPIDWKLIIGWASLLISIFVVFFGNNLCNSPNPPRWLIPAINIVCPSLISPATAPDSVPSPTDTPTVPTPTQIALSRVIGSWTNEDANAQNIIYINIDFVANSYDVEIWERHGNIESFWLNTTAIRLSNITTSGMTIIRTIDHSEEVIVNLEVLADGRLMAVVYDPSAEGDPLYTSYFVKKTGK